MRERVRHLGPGLAALVFVGLSLFAALLRNPSLTEVVASQTRAEVVTARLGDGADISQTLVVGKLLSTFEVTVARSLAVPLPSGAMVTLLVECQAPGSGRMVAARRPARGLSNGSVLRFDLSPMPLACDQPIRLRLESDPGLDIALWASRTEAYSAGTWMQGGAEQAGDLAFTAYSPYTLRHAMLDALHATARSARTTALLVIVLGLPGLCLVFWLMPARLLSIVELIAISLGCSVSCWALLYLWAILGIRLSDRLLWVIVAVLFTLLLARVLLCQRRRAWPWTRGDLRQAVFVGITLTSAWGLRLLQIRHLVVPNWVDGYHHSVLAQLLASAGALPTTGAPYVEFEAFHYHFGFHASASVLSLLGEMSAPDAVLYLGQALNALAGLGACALASRLTGRAWAGAVAAVVTSFLSYMPAYYVSWGRYTQLAGLLVLPAVICLLEIAATEAHWRTWLLAGLVAGGLALTHYRVLAFLLVWCLCRAILPPPRLTADWRGRLGRWATSVVAVALTALVAISPWVWRFVAVGRNIAEDVYGGWEMPAGVVDPMPTGLLRYGWTPALLAISAVSCGWAIRRKQSGLLSLSLTCAALVTWANVDILGLRPTWLIGNTAVAISYWLPASVLCGWLAVEVADGVDALVRHLKVLGNARAWLMSGAMGALGVLGGCGAWRQVDIVNPTTTLVSRSDMRGMQWAKENLPADAVVLINSQPWKDAVRMGADGGWWLPLIAGRQTTLPSVLYVQGPARYRADIEAFAALVEGAPSLSEASLWDTVRLHGVTHIFVGTRGGRLSASELDGNACCELLYGEDSVRIYAVRQPERPRPMEPTSLAVPVRSEHPPPAR